MIWTATWVDVAKIAAAALGDDEAPWAKREEVGWRSLRSLFLFIFLHGTSLHRTLGTCIWLYCRLRPECKLCENRDTVLITTPHCHLERCLLWAASIIIVGLRDEPRERGCDGDVTGMISRVRSDAPQLRDHKTWNTFRKEEDKSSHKVNILWDVFSE